MLLQIWVVLHCVYIPHLLYPFIYQWTLRLFPYLGYCKLCCYEHWGACIFSNYVFLQKLIGICRMIIFFKETTDLFWNPFLGTLLLFSDTQIQDNTKEDSCGFTKWVNSWQHYIVKGVSVLTQVVRILNSSKALFLLIYIQTKKPKKPRKQNQKTPYSINQGRTACRQIIQIS